MDERAGIEQYPASKDEEIRMLRDQIARMKAQWIDRLSHGLRDGPRDSRRNAVAANWDEDYPFVLSAEIVPVSPVCADREAVVEAAQAVLEESIPIIGEDAAHVPNAALTALESALDALRATPEPEGAEMAREGG